MTATIATAKPRVILGLMTFGPDSARGGRITAVEDFSSCLTYFASHGYTELDTARVYAGGAQESFTASALAQTNKAARFSVATKWYPQKPGDGAPEVVREMLTKSLAELGRDSVDIFYLHAADRSRSWVDTLRECDALHREGKFARLGLSNMAAYEVAEIVMTCRAHGWLQPTVYQGKYHALHRALDKELIPACHRYGLSVVVYNPLAAGLFSGKYHQHASTAEIPETGRFSNVSAGFGAMYRARYFKDANFEALRLIEPVAQEHGLALPEVALRWLVHHSALNTQAPAGPVNGNGAVNGEGQGATGAKDDTRDGIVIGVSSQAQLESNIADLEKGPLPDEMVQALDKAAAMCAAIEGPYWHGELKYGYELK